MSGDEEAASCTRRYLDELLVENLQLRGDVERGDRETADLRRQVDELRQELRRRQRERQGLLDLVGLAEAEARRHEQRSVELERHHGELATLCAASRRLQGARDRGQILTAIKEIAFELVGSEELVLYTLDGPGALVPLDTCGVAFQRVSALRSDVGVVARALALGDPAVSQDEPDPQGVWACVPLAAGGRILAVLVILRLLPQKQGLGPLDEELLRILATHAAAALHGAEGLS